MSESGRVNYNLTSATASKEEYIYLIISLVLTLLVFLAASFHIIILTKLIIAQDQATVHIITSLRRFSDYTADPEDEIYLGPYTKYTDAFLEMRRCLFDTAIMLYEVCQDIVTRNLHMLQRFQHRALVLKNAENRVILDTEQLPTSVLLRADSNNDEESSTTALVLNDILSLISNPNAEDDSLTHTRLDLEITNVDSGIPTSGHGFDLPHVVIVKILSVENITTGNGGMLGLTVVDNSNPYVIMNVISESSCCMGSATSRVVDRSSTVHWDQALTMSVSPTDRLVINVVGWNNVVFHEFLGQAVVDFSSNFHEITSIFNGGKLELELPLLPRVHPVYDSNGNIFSPTESQKPSGTLNVEISAPALSSSMCGFLIYQNTSVWGAVISERVWVVLVNDFLYCYDNPYGGDSVLRKLYNCTSTLDVVSIDGPVFNKSDGTSCGFKLTVSGSDDPLIFGCISSLPGKAEVERQLWITALSVYTNKGNDYDRIITSDPHATYSSYTEFISSSSPYTVK
jgi:hypothetical protein